MPHHTPHIYTTQTVASSNRNAVEKKGREVSIRDPLNPLKRGDAPALTLAQRATLAATATAAGASFDAIPPCEALGVPTPVADKRAAIAFVGGETTALARLEHYTFGTCNCTPVYHLNMLEDIP